MRILFNFLAALLFASSAAAQDQSIEDVIGSQLEAFNARDVDDAWRYASPMIQGMFGTSRNFGAMVENGYPMVWTNRDVEFLERREEQGQQVQRLLLRDESGAAHVLEYMMIDTPDGWRINGVQLLPAPDVAA